jgi:MFS family permease
VGGVIGGILLEVTGRIKPTVKAAVVSTAIYGVTTLFFALTSSYLLALAMLLIGGIANLAAMSIGQTIVQLLAPPADRGRVIGLYGVSANGLRAGSGFTSASSAPPSASTGHWVCPPWPCAWARWPPDLCPARPRDRLTSRPGPGCS